MPASRLPAPATVKLTLWLDADGHWHACVVLPGGEHVEFDSPFELARWSRGFAAPAPASLHADGGLR